MRAYLIRGMALVSLLVIVVVLFLYDPATTGRFPPCPLFALTGVKCPGCGSLRAVHQLLHGNLRAAFLLNPLMILSIPVLFMIGVTDLFPSRMSPCRYPRIATLGIIGAVLAWTIMRNL